MENTKKRMIGISVFTTIALAVVLMFSMFANARELVKVDSENSNAENSVKFTMTTGDDPFGNQMTVYYVNDEKQENPQDSVSLDVETTWTWDYSGRTIVIKDPAAAAESQVKYTINWTIADKTLFDLQSVALYQTTSSGRQIVDTEFSGKTITEAITLDTTANNRDYNFVLNTVSPSFTDLVPTMGYYTLSTNAPSGYWTLMWMTDSSNHQYQVLSNSGSMPLGQAIHAGASISVDESNYQIHIKDYSNMDETKTLYDVTITFNTYAAGFEVYDFSVGYDSFHKIGETVTDDVYADTTLVSRPISINGIQYSVVTLDAIKYILLRDSRLRNDESSDVNALGIELPEGYEQIINAIPSSVAIVTGVDEDCPADVEIPNFISTDEITGYTFPVMGVYDMNSSKIKSIKFNYNMKIVYNDCCTGCTNLESITYSDSGLAFVPDIQRTIDYRSRLSEISQQEAEGTISSETAEALRQAAEDDYENDLSAMHAFPFVQLASVLIPNYSYPRLVVANDNTYCSWGIDYKSNMRIKTSSIGGLRGTFQKANELKFNDYPKLKAMVAVGSLSARVLDQATQQPVIGAKVEYSDELGIEHTAYTNQMGVFTFDDMYQTGGAFINSKDSSEVFDFHYRKISITADGYKPIYFDEETYEPSNKSSEAVSKWGFGCYSYFTQWGTLSSDVIYETPFSMTRLYSTGYLASAANFNYVVDVSAGSQVSGANVQIYQSNQSDAQKFSFIAGTDENGSTYFTIVNVNSGKVLDVSGGVAENCRNVQQYDANDSAAQRWYPEQSGDYVVFHSAIDTNYVLDVNGGNAVNGQNIQIYQENGSPAQQFLFLQGTPAVPGGDFDLKDGYYVVRSAIPYSDNVLDVQWGSSEDGANVWAYEYAKGNTNQIWHVEQIDFGYYKLTNVNTGKVLDVSGCGIIPGTNVWQYSDNGTAAQMWAINKVNVNGTAYYQLVNAGTGLTLDLAGASTESGTNVQGYFDNGTEAQMWEFYEVDPSTF